MTDIEDLHKIAVSKGETTYTDPKSGYQVFTKETLKKKPCCGNGCRHCPYKPADSSFSNRKILDSSSLFFAASS